MIDVAPQEYVDRFTIDLACSRCRPIPAPAPTSCLAPRFGHLDEEQLLLLGKQVAIKYRNGFLIEESDGSTRIITGTEMLAGRMYAAHQSEIADNQGCCGHHDYRTAANGTRICIHTSETCRFDSLRHVLSLVSQIQGVRPMSTALADRSTTSLISATLREGVQNLATVTREAQQALIAGRNAGEFMENAFIKAAGIQAIRDAFTDDLLHVVMQIMDTKLGFKTDKDPKTWAGKGPAPRYSDSVIRDVLIEGCIQGARWDGNEINIISGGLYLTREFYERAFLDLPGVSQVKPPALGVPRKINISGDDICYAETNASLEFCVDGKPAVTDCTGDKAIRVRWNKGGTIDFIHGKTRKRLYKIAYEQASGHTFDEADTDGVITGLVLSETTVEPQLPDSEVAKPKRTRRTKSQMEADAKAASQVKRFSEWEKQLIGVTAENANQMGADLVDADLSDSQYEELRDRLDKQLAGNMQSQDLFEKGPAME